MIYFTFTFRFSLLCFFSFHRKLLHYYFDFLLHLMSSPEYDWLQNLLPHSNEPIMQSLEESFICGRLEARELFNLLLIG